MTTSDLILLDFISSAQKAMCNFSFYLQHLEAQYRLHRHGI